MNLLLYTFCNVFFSGLTLFAIFRRKNIQKSRICRSVKLEQMCVYQLSIPRKEECLRNRVYYWPPFRAASGLKSIEFHQLTSFVVCWSMCFLVIMAFIYQTVVHQNCWHMLISMHRSVFINLDMCVSTLVI